MAPSGTLRLFGRDVACGPRDRVHPSPPHRTSDMAQLEPAMDIQSSTEYEDDSGDDLNQQVRRYLDPVHDYGAYI